MKKKDISFLLGLVSFILYLVLIFLSAADQTDEFAQIMVVTLPFVIGLGFILSDGKVLKNTGYLLLSLMSALMLGSLIDFDKPQNMPGTQPQQTDFNFLALFISLFLLASVLVYFVSLVLSYFGFYREGIISNPTTSNKVLILKKWNKLVETNKIDNNDYELIKSKLLLSKITKEEELKLEEIRQLLEANLANRNDLVEVLK